MSHVPNAPVTPDPWDKPFANGYDHFCEYCGQFFSIDTSITPDEKPGFCPFCGNHDIISTQREFIGWCIDRQEDPINHFHVLDGDDAVPGSKSTVTPNELWSVIRAQRSLELLEEAQNLENISIQAELSEATVSECLEIINAGEEV